MKKSLLLLFVLAWTLAASTSVFADLKEDLTALQGTWKGTTEREEGKIEMEMVVKDNVATLTIKGPDGSEVLKFKTDLKLEKMGKFQALTFTNAETADGQKLFQDGDSRSYIYKLSGSDMSTAGGFGEGDDQPATLTKWTKK